jgi:hypothetical protein
MTTDNPKSSTRIRALNDAFRRSFAGGAVVVTAGLAAIPAVQRRSLLRMVRDFEAFDEDNDPHGEHGLGVVEVGGVRCFWKIDYDRAMETLSPDPADPSVTNRVLTVMLTEEY